MKKFIILIFAMALIYSCEEIISVPDISEDFIVLIAPADGTVLEDIDVTFSWEEIEFAEEYQIQVAQPNFTNANQVVLDTILGDSVQSFRSFSTTLAPNMYQWRVRGFNDNFQTDYTTQSFKIDTLQTDVDISDQLVTAIAPVDNAEITAGNINFNWEAVANATMYQLQIAYPNFQSPIQIVRDTLITTPLYTTTLESNDYQWRVKAMNISYETAYTTQSLSVIDDMVNLSDQIVEIIAPEDGFETSETMVNLSWQAIEQATLYRIIITDLSDNSIFLEQTVTTTDITIEFVSGMYSWAVRAENDTQNTPYTEQTITIL
ncbi:hypothetical protein [uncultured Dokdonia sp.]|mgnify:CR=1 FL=1|uniref:hypothetical protein n=1 Tax=uncultured Dokdonia sp. TaxID=575653 RepID=UPI002602E24D|nr:hypothetical protein [uncultured Dokdonia sp.]